MPSKLDILSQVLQSYSLKQSKTMNAINALLNNREVESDINNKLEMEIEKLAMVHACIQEVEYFLIQVRTSELAAEVEKTSIDKIGSSGDVDVKDKQSEK